jgi:REP element-mobilizing transposase RayT
MARAPRLRFGVDYHIYQRSIDKEELFVEESDYARFLTLYEQHIAPVAGTYAYCLLPNHLHLLVRIWTQEEQLARSQGRRRVLSPGRQFTNLFDAYGKEVNEARGRSAALFQPAFGRVGLSSSFYRDLLAVHIHRNPMEHGLVKDYRQWPYSSFSAPQALCSLRDELFSVLRAPGGFVKAHYHQWPVPQEQVARLAPDDFD